MCCWFLLFGASGIRRAESEDEEPLATRARDNWSARRSAAEERHCSRPPAESAAKERQRVRYHRLKEPEESPTRATAEGDQPGCGGDSE